MNKYILTLLVGVVAVLGFNSSLAMAKDKTHVRTSPGSMTLTDDNSIRSTQSASRGTGGFHLGAGVATSSGFSNTATALTGWFGLSDNLGIQAYLAFPSVSPVLFFAGGILKATVHGEGRGAGFHVGGGLGMGNTGGAGSSFTLSLGPVGGFHFAVPSLSQIMIHVDTGAFLTLVNTAGGLAAGFGLASISPTLGLSIFYVF